MSMSTHMLGFHPPDKKWKQMKAVWDSCEKAGVDIPENVLEFFGGVDAPDERGVEIDLEELPCCSEYDDDGQEGFEIDISKLPENITHLRFFNGY